MMAKGFFEFLTEFNRTSLVPIKSITDLPAMISALEQFSRFESAKRIKDWYLDFIADIESEFDDDCLKESIPQMPDYVLGEEVDLGGWVHDWELPSAYLPPLEGGDSGTFTYGSDENL
jgi:hypothetical protein